MRRPGGSGKSRRPRRQPQLSSLASVTQAPARAAVNPAVTVTRLALAAAAAAAAAPGSDCRSGGPRLLGP